MKLTGRQKANLPIVLQEMPNDSTEIYVGLAGLVVICQNWHAIIAGNGRIIWLSMGDVS